MRALYDYEAMSDEELSFKEGEIIGVLRKDDGAVDDGFWLGEFQGKRGVFPSLVVEDHPEGSDTMDTNMNVANSITRVSSSTRAGDYVTLPSDYKVGAPTPSSLLQPVRVAPPPPSSPQTERSSRFSAGGATASLQPVEWSRAKTENVNSMRKPDGAAFSRSISQSSAVSSKTYVNINQLQSSKPPDYVNVTDLPSSGGSTSACPPSNAPKPMARSRRPAPPPKPPPPAAVSNKSESYV